MPVFPLRQSNLQAWFSPRRRGLVASIVVSGYGFGSCIWTPLQTLYINPDNLNATSDNNTSCGDNKTKYYQDEGEQLKLWSFQRNKVNKQKFKSRVLHFMRSRSSNFNTTQKEQ